MEHHLNLLVVHGGSWQNSRCTNCNTSNLYVGGTITFSCNDCGKTLTGTMATQNVVCYSGLHHIFYNTDGTAYHSGYTVWDMCNKQSCGSVLNKTKYSQSCGLTSGILDQD